MKAYAPLLILAMAVNCLPIVGGDAVAEDVSISTGGGRYSKGVRTFKDIREAGVVLQALDYSCGAAAMATLFTHFFADQVKESEVIGFIFVHGQTPEEGIKKYFKRQGFSLLDLKRFATFRGYQAAGYKEMLLDDLVEFLYQEQVPILVPIRPFGYHHFVVVRGFRGDRIYLADPALGRTSMKISQFLNVWVDGIGFIIKRKEIASRKLSPVDDGELGQITAAGAPSATKTIRRRSVPDIVLIDPAEPFVDNRQLRPVLERQAQTNAQRLRQVFTTEDLSNNLFSRFEVQNYDPNVQFGDPAGDFVDFTPQAEALSNNPPETVQ